MRSKSLSSILQRSPATQSDPVDNMTRTNSPVLLAVPLWMCFGRAAALGEPEICYVLDGILFLYGLVLTILYCRLQIISARSTTVVKKPKGKAKAGSDGIYLDLNPHPVDTYEVIGFKK